MKGITINLPELLALGHPKKIMETSSAQVKNKSIGQHHSRSRGRGMEFDQVRRYESGDDIRAIDWRVTARTNKPHTKLFHEEKEQLTYILVDQSASLFFGSQQELKSVTAARIAAFFAWQSFYQKDRIGGVIIGNEKIETIKPISGKPGLYQFLHHLIDYNHQLYKAMEKPKIQSNTPQKNNLQFEQSLLLLTHLVKTGARIIIISDFYYCENSGYNLIAQLSKKNQLIGLHIYDLFEKELPKNGLYTVTNGVERFNINTSPVQLRNQFRESFKQKQISLQTHFQQHAATWMTMGTHQHLPENL